jgi:hypothetical protein
MILLSSLQEPFFVSFPSNCVACKGCSTIPPSHASPMRAGGTPAARQAVRSFCRHRRSTPGPLRGWGAAPRSCQTPSVPRGRCCGPRAAPRRIPPPRASRGIVPSGWSAADIPGGHSWGMPWRQGTSSNPCRSRAAAPKRVLVGSPRCCDAPALTKQAVAVGTASGSSPLFRGCKEPNSPFPCCASHAARVGSWEGRCCGCPCAQLAY